MLWIIIRIILFHFHFLLLPILYRAMHLWMFDISITPDTWWDLHAIIYVLLHNVLCDLVKIDLKFELKVPSLILRTEIKHIKIHVYFDLFRWMLA